MEGVRNADVFRVSKAKFSFILKVFQTLESIARVIAYYKKTSPKSAHLFATSISMPIAVLQIFCTLRQRRFKMILFFIILFLMFFQAGIDCWQVAEQFKQQTFMTFPSVLFG